MTKEELGKLLKEVALLKGEFTLRSGRKSNYYFDKYLFETRPEVLAPLAKEIAHLLPPLDTFDRIAGPELGAVALATALSLEVKKPFVIVRKEEKGYGTSKIVEGEIKKGEKVVMVEDIITTAGAAISAADRLKHSGIEVILLIGVLDREEGGKDNVEAAGYKFASVFTKTMLGI
jgi:orotate phosphoribosyltransferase